MSHFLHKVKEAVTGDKHSDNPSSTNAGPQSSNVANKADPRVDSDHDNRGAYGSSYDSGSKTYGSESTNYGPHESNLANKLDPRVDSDRDNRGATGVYGPSTSYGSESNTGYGSSNTYGSGSTNYSPHDSNIANKLDPRIDSDQDNRARHQNFGGDAFGSSSYNTPGSGNARRTAGPHNSDIANKLDPRVDSNLDNSRHFGDVTNY